MLEMFILERMVTCISRLVTAGHSVTEAITAKPFGPPSGHKRRIPFSGDVLFLFGPRY
jgi:hypothetical protein